jgi:tRNA G18 (ribose-2'-O)-methylase SpoU
MRPDIKKTSLGASNTVSWSYHANANHLLSHIRTAAPDTDIVAVERTVDAIALRELPHDTVRPRIYIFGNEVTGVPAAVLQQSHYVVALPMQGTKESLNVATTAGIVLYDALVR